MKKPLYSLNISVDIDYYGWIKINSEKNISKNIKKLTYLDIYEFKKNNIYKFNLKVPLDKKHNQLTYNLSPIGNFKLNKVESAGFLKIDSYNVKNGVIEVKYSYNYFSIALMIFGLLAIIGGTLYYTQYLNKLFKNNATSIYEKSKIKKKYIFSMTLYSLYIVGILISLMILCDSPLFVSYILV